jgi:hypothetical protein
MTRMNGIILVLLMVSFLSWSSPASLCFADEGTAISHICGEKGYFRIEIARVPQTSPDDNNNRILIETYDIKDLPAIQDLRDYPDLVKELKGYIQQGFKYVKLEVTMAGGRRSKKIELYREGGANRGKGE